MKSHQFFYCLMLSFFIFSCSSSNDSIETPRTADDVRNDFKKLSIQKGANDLKLESLTRGFFWNFRLIVPEEAGQNNMRPLIVRLHGAASTPSSNAHLSTQCLVEPGFEDLKPYILSPNSSGYFWHDTPNIIQVQALVDMVKSNLYVNSNRIVVMGYSDGGNGSWFFSQYYPNLFSAAIPLASSYISRNSSNNVEKIDIPLYVIHGTEDELFPISTIKGYVEEYKSVGTNVTLVEATNLLHNEPCTYVPYLKEAALWLENEVWK
jgi:predicted peptidase